MVKSLNLHTNYYQIEIADADVQKTVFRSHEGSLVLPFSLTDAPAAFQREINEVQIFPSSWCILMISWCSAEMLKSTDSTSVKCRNC